MPNSLTLSPMQSLEPGGGGLTKDVEVYLSPYPLFLRRILLGRLLERDGRAAAAQNVLLDLARRRLGQLVDKGNGMGRFEMRHQQRKHLVWRFALG